MPTMKLHANNPMSNRMISQQRGFTLLEVMVALVIFSIGLLGLADLQIKSVDYTNGAYQRTQASFLISDIMDRMRANKAYALTGGYDVSNTNKFSQTTSCTGTSANCNPSSQEKADLTEWKQALQVLPNGYGSISSNPSGATTTFTVSVTWDDAHANNATKTTTISVTGEL